MKYLFALFMSCFAYYAISQNIEGRILDANNLEPLIGATILVEGTSQGAVADERGVFLIDDLPAGRYMLKASFVQHSPYLLPNVWVKNGKVTSVEILLEPSSDLNEVIVSASRATISPGRIGISEEQINRYAASYNDAARVMLSSPDLAVTNDQNNLVSVRGLSPALNIWKLEGAEIVNPNHLSNAGTFLDQPTATGGGVNILSAQMLDNSQFLYGGFSSEYGNSSAGIFDMNIKKGSKNRQHTVQASLIGFDFATEGAFDKGGRTTYAANYRYSFTGLLAQFGVDFGGEEIGFQDLSLSITSQIGEKSELKVFAIGGLSFNEFDKPEVIEREKDRSDIDYDSKMGAVGASFRTGLKNGTFTASVVYSKVENERISNPVDSAKNARSIADTSTPTYFNNQHDILSVSSEWKSKLIEEVTSRVGLMTNFYAYELSQHTDYIGGFQLTNTSGRSGQILFRPYWDLDISLANRLLWSLGVSMSITEGALEYDPRSALTYSFSEGQLLTASVGIYNQLQRPYNYFHGDLTNENEFSSRLRFQKSSRYILNYSGGFGDFEVTSELFYYLFPEIPNIAIGALKSTSYGMSISLERALYNGFYFQTGGSLFEAEIGGVESPYNTGYSARVTTGKEWSRTKNGKDKSFGVNVRGLMQGGRVLTLDENLLTSIFQRYETDPYLRLDLRFIWTKHHSDWTSSIALDLQNVLNRENEAYRYFDSVTQHVETQNQLGLIPILTYRAEW